MAQHYYMEVENNYKINEHKVMEVQKVQAQYRLYLLYLKPLDIGKRRKHPFTSFCTAGEFFLKIYIVS